MVTWIHGLRRLLCRSRAEEGSTLVEFALTIVMFLVLAFAIIDFGHVFFVELEVQDAIQEAARYGTTGNHVTITNPKDGTQTTLSRVNSIITILQQTALTANIPTTAIQISSISTVPGSTSVPNSAGGPGDLVTVTATYNVPMFTPFLAQMFPNGLPFKASVTIMNEKFLPSSS